MAMTASVRQALSPALFAFFDCLKTAGYEAPSKVKSEVIADLFRQFFGIPCPMLTHDASSLLQRFRYSDVFLQPGLERHKHVRGFWGVHDNKVLILLDAARPDPSKIKSLLHEIAEMLLKIDYDSNKQACELSDKDREKWANSFAAMVKMPREVFLPAVEMYGIDLPLLSEIFCETLAGISRHIRDLYMPDRPFYFGRVSLEHDPERKCSDLIPCLEQSGGVCVYVADAAKTNSVSTHRRHGGALPTWGSIACS